MNNRFNREFGRGTCRDECFYGMMGPGLDICCSASLKLDAKGIQLDRKPESWDLFKQTVEAHAGILGFYPAL